MSAISLGDTILYKQSFKQIVGIETDTGKTIYIIEYEGELIEVPSDEAIRVISKYDEVYVHGDTHRYIVEAINYDVGRCVLVRDVKISDLIPVSQKLYSQYQINDYVLYQGKYEKIVGIETDNNITSYVIEINNDGRLEYKYVNIDDLNLENRN